MNGNDTFLDVNNAHLRVTSGNVYASAFNLDQIDIVMSSNTASTVNFNNPTKAFNAASNIEVGTANLFVDTTTTRVGVGTTSPATTLDVAGDLNVSGNLTILGTTTTLDTDHLRVQDPIIELGKDNTASPVVDLGLLMTRPAGSSNVGIIFDESADTLEIGYTQGNASDSTITMDSTHLSVNVNGDLSVTSNIEVGTANLFVDTTIGKVTMNEAKVSSNLEVGTANLFVDTINSRVGIGTTSPVAKLNIQGTSEGAPPTSGGEGTSNGIFRLRDNFNVALDIGTFGTSPWTTWLQVADTTTMGTAYPLSLNPNGGNVGIGTLYPATYLHLSAKNSNPGATEGDGVGTHDLTEYLRFTSTFDGGDVNAVSVGFKLGADDNSSVSPDGRLDICANDGAVAGNSYGATPDRTIATFLGSGNVGIGTTSPTEALHIYRDGTDPTYIWAIGNTSDRAGIAFSEDASSKHAIIEYNGTGSDAGNYLAIYSGVSGWTSMGAGLNFIPANGRVGIGTTSPVAKLHVYDDTADASWRNFYVRPTSLWGDGLTTASETLGTKYMTANMIMLQGPHITPSNTGGDAYIRYGRAGGIQSGVWWETACVTDGSFRIRREAADAYGMTITSAGHVGIGTTNPEAKLHLYQSAGSTNLVEKHTNASTGQYQQHINYTHYASVAGGPTRNPDNSRGLWIGNMVDENDGSPSGANFAAFTDSFQFYAVADRTKYDSSLSFTSNTDNLLYSGGTFTKVMRINADGSVGIGTTNPVATLTLNTYSGPSSLGCLMIGANDSSQNLRIGVDNTDEYCWIQSHLGKPLRLNPDGNAIQYGTSDTTLSDDRIKYNEMYIENATDTLLKLKPQVYDKKLVWNISKLGESANIVRESGLITQDVWYDAPELRHLVTLGKDASPVTEKPFTDDNPQNDPDYSSWGDHVSTLDYTGIIPYLIKSNQELHARIQAIENAS